MGEASAHTQGRVPCQALTWPHPHTLNTREPLIAGVRKAALGPLAGSRSGAELRQQDAASRGESAGELQSVPALRRSITGLLTPVPSSRSRPALTS